MQLDDKQRGVVRGMGAGMLVSLVVVGFGSRWFVGLDASERWGISLLLPACALFIAIARLAKHRFFTAKDIDGSALGVGSDRARQLQALIQNTLEQIALAVPVYLAALSSPHPRMQAAVPACAMTFLVGRLAFFATYRAGAQARAFGFALTFYPTGLLLAWLLSSCIGVVAG